MILFKPEFLVFTIAVSIDLIFGEWPNAIHPVVWMGRMVKLFDIPSRSKVARFFMGTILLTADIGVWLTIAFSVSSVPGIIGIVLRAFLLKSTFSVKALYSHVRRCAREDTEKMRKEVSMIVSRDTKELDRAHLVSAALESLSENTSDSVTGPFLYYVFFGLAGAVVYRVVNTLDAIVGYRTEKFELFGKAAARTDDLLNLIPSRLTGMVFGIFSPVRAFAAMKKYGPLKINATYPMSAFSGVLGIWFEKIGLYSFEGKAPKMSDIFRGLKIYSASVAILLATFIAVTVVR